MPPIAALLVLALGATLAPEVERHRLENGLTILLRPIPKAGAVAVHTQYQAGCFDNPVGAAQATEVLATLLAELVPAEEALLEPWLGLLQEGRVSSRYDGQRSQFECVISGAELENVLRVEAQRLAGPAVDPELHARVLAAKLEAFQDPGRSGSDLELALAALAQAWRYGQQELSLAQELRALTPQALDELSGRLYRPDRATLLIAGDFEPGRALQLVRRHIGATLPPASELKLAASTRRRAFDWSDVPRRTTMHWDGGFSAVCIASAVPEDPSDALLIALYGAELQRRLQADKELARFTRSVTADSLESGLDELPGFVFAIAAEGVTAEALEPHLLAALKKVIEDLPSPTSLLKLNTRARRLARSSDLLSANSMAAERVRLEASGQDPEEALRKVLGASTREIARVERLFVSGSGGNSGGDPGDHPGGGSQEMLRRLAEVTPQALHSLLRESFSERQRRRTLLERFVQEDPASGDGR